MSFPRGERGLWGRGLHATKGQPMNLRGSESHTIPSAPTGMSVWFRDHAEHHMAVLLSPSGPFAGIGTGKDREHTNEKGELLPYVEPPDGLFPDMRKTG